MQYGKLNYNISFAQSRLEAIANKALDVALAKDDMEVNGVHVSMSKSGPSSTTLEGKSLQVSVPLDIHVRRDAGLFTIEGSGGISLALKINYDINRDLQLKCKTELVDYQWITKPKLEVGALNIPIETLMNLALKHYESVLTAKVDEAINTNTNLLPIIYKSVQTLEGQINGLLKIASDVDIKLGHMENMTPRSESEKVNLRGNIELGLSIQEASKGKDDLLPTVGWATKAGASIPIETDLYISYSDLVQKMLSKVAGKEIGGKKIVVSHMEVTKSDMLRINADLQQPIKGSVEIEANMEYIAGVIDAKNLNVKVNPSNFIYKMTAPIVNRFIENRLEEFLPFNIQNKVNESLLNLPEKVDMPMGAIYPFINQIDIDQVDFEEEGIRAHASFHDVALDIAID